MIRLLASELREEVAARKQARLAATASRHTLFAGWRPAIVTLAVCVALIAIL